MKTTILTSAAIAVTVIFGVAASATPAAVNLVINEVNANTLTYSWQGAALVTVTTTTADKWQFNIIDDVITPLSSSQQVFTQWQEPDYANSGQVNLVEFYQYGPAANGSTIWVWSDVQYNTGYTLTNNGSIYSFNPPIPSGNTVQFNDNGDSSGVPDGGSTLLMLGLAGIGLGLFVRKFQAA